MELELLPCPCCGGKVKIINGSDRGADYANCYIECPVCKLSSATYNDVHHNFEYLKRALSEWNRRYTQPENEEKVLDNEPRTI